MQINQVLLPFASVVTCSIIILIVWQVLSPLVWIRTITNEDEAEDEWNSYGECNSEDGALPYIIPLGFIIAISVFMTAGISWKLKDVQGKLALLFGTQEDFNLIPNL